MEHVFYSAGFNYLKCFVSEIIQYKTTQHKYLYPSFNTRAHDYPWSAGVAGQPI